MSLRLQSLPQFAQHLLGHRKLMINVDHHDQIERAPGQPRVSLGPQDGNYVGNALGRRIAPKPLQHFWLYVVCKYLSRRSHLTRDSQAVESGTCSDVTHQHSWPQCQSVQHFPWLLFPFALAAIEPVSAANSHDRRNVPAGNRVRSRFLTIGGANGTHRQNREKASPPESKSRVHHLFDRAPALLIIALLFLPNVFLAAVMRAESALAIIGGVVQSSEDSLPVGQEYRFLPGDYLHFTFGIAGFQIDSEKEGQVRKIALTYEVTPEDSKGVPLTPVVNGSIETELSPEDKNWTPKRRTSFLLPAFVAAGEYKIHVSVKDLVAKTEVSQRFPFHIGGVAVIPSTTIAASDFHFFRREDDREPLEVAAYAPGDTVYAKFNMTGFQVTQHKNDYHVAYGVAVLRPTGKPYFEQSVAADLQADSFYPAQYLPGELALTTSKDATKGAYVIVLTVRDLIGNQSHVSRYSFTIE